MHRSAAAANMQLSEDDAYELAEKLRGVDAATVTRRVPQHPASDVQAVVCGVHKLIRRDHGFAAAVVHDVFQAVCGHPPDAKAIDTGCVDNTAWCSYVGLGLGLVLLAALVGSAVARADGV